MEVRAIVREIKRLPLSKRFLIIEQTLKSIKKEELSPQIDEDIEEDKGVNYSDISVNHESLAKDWLSSEDNRWDKIL
ncbi:MAG: hypothetical protein SFY32_09645 [Bacteroidota bacterium]|nr:hypothetical protein [Bacteroidota bacterium]